MAKRTMKAFQAGRKAKRVYQCDDCRAQHSDKVHMCRTCKSMNVIHFSSRAECKRYNELKLLLKAGKIRDLETQKRFALNAYNEGVAVKIGHFVADFAYYDIYRGKDVVEDVKGVGCPLTELADWKIKHFAKEYNQEVEIVRR